MTPPSFTPPLASRLIAKRIRIRASRDPRLVRVIMPTPINETPTQEIPIYRPPKKSILKRHRWIKWTILIMATPFALAVLIGSVEGLAASVSGPGVINIVHTNSYDDCLTLARQDRFAPEVCEGLINPAATSTGSFNDGFATSKQDDCQQGDIKACTWLKITKR